MVEIPTPPVLAVPGGAWFGADGVEIHLGVDSAFVPASKAHPGILVDDIDRLAARLTSAQREIRWDGGFPDFRRFYTDDPFGNRLEFLAQNS